MCGFVGIVNFNNPEPLTPRILNRMADTIAHRGPDDSGLYLDPAYPQCALAHRRLSIIDLAGGAQPMLSPDQNFCIAYNGECYNFQSLRDQLIAQGHTFNTQSDTEVILQLYQKFGPQCVNHLRGMFAFAIWDKKSRQLFLARDRLGKKPLFYAQHNGMILFASQPKALLQFPGFPRKPDLPAITQYLLWQYVPSPRSGFEGIAQLPPAHTLTLNPANYKTQSPRRYWHIDPENRFTGTFHDAADLLKSELLTAVKLRLISDVPLGAFLSGGLDSSIIVALMAQADPRPVKTCSIGFADSLYNELPWAHQIVQRYNTDHVEQIVKPDSPATIQQLVEFYDEPFADCSALPTFLLAKLARRHVTVALTGDGGDECFGGYGRYRGLQVAERLDQWRLIRFLVTRGWCRKWVCGEQRSFLHRLGRFVETLHRPPHQRYLQWLAVFNPDLINNLISKAPGLEPALSQAEGPGVPPANWDALADYFPRGRDGVSSSERAMLTDAQLYLPGDLNTKTDRASMAVGLELRCPFEDHHVVELAYSLPLSWRCSMRRGKIILCKAFGQRVPPGILRRSKRGFGVPVGSWFRSQLRDLFIDTVLSPRAKQRGLFNPASVQSLLDQNDRRQNDHGHRLWSLLMLELWFQRYID